MATTATVLLQCTFVTPQTDTVRVKICETLNAFSSIKQERLQNVGQIETLQTQICSQPEAAGDAISGHHHTDMQVYIVENCQVRPAGYAQ